jgi:hypothetical protein
LRSNCLVKHVTEGTIRREDDTSGEEEELLDHKGNVRILVFERGRARSHSVENSLWKRLWTCRMTDYGTVIILQQNSS